MVLSYTCFFSHCSFCLETLLDCFSIRTIRNQIFGFYRRLGSIIKWTKKNVFNCIQLGYDLFVLFYYERAIFRPPDAPQKAPESGVWGSILDELNINTFYDVLEIIVVIEFTRFAPFV